MNCCDDYGKCTRGHGCPAGPGPEPKPTKEPRDLPIQFAGPEPDVSVEEEPSAEIVIDGEGEVSIKWVGNPADFIVGRKLYIRASDRALDPIDTRKPSTGFQS